MKHNPRRIVIVSAVSGLLVFGAAGFAAASTGGSHRIQVDVTTPSTDGSSTTDASSSTMATTPGSEVGDDNGTEVGDDNGTDAVTGSSVEDQGDDNGTEVGDDDATNSTEVENEADDDTNSTMVAPGPGTITSVDDHGGDSGHGGSSDD